MKTITLSLLLGLGLAAGFVSCKGTSSQEVSPSASQAPDGMRIAEFTFTERDP